MIIVQRKGQSVRFAILLEPEESAGRPIVKSMTLTQGPVLLVIIAHFRGEDRVSFPTEKLDSLLKNLTL